MKRLFTLGLFLLSVTLMSAQQKVALQSNGATTFFNSASAFVDAYNAAVDGDTIYLPGLQYNSPATIQKRLAVFGTGYHPENTEATGRTRIGAILIRDGGSGSHFEGMYVEGSIKLAGALVQDITFKRMHVSGNIELFRASNDACQDCRNITVQECVAQAIVGIYAKADGVEISNSILKQVSYFNNPDNGLVRVANNVIVDSYYNIYYLNNAMIENNVFARTNSSTSYSSVAVSHGNMFRHNVFSDNPVGPEINTWSDNWVNIDPNTFFVAYTPTYAYENNYQLAAPASYTGSTGNEVGLFGGYMPFKLNTRPSIPQIIQQQVAGEVGAAGTLQVDIQVEAQQ
ncbi:hypothetical protein [Geofilum rubicundum]|nr:hypothetical protein [Geofilum rubicundum]